MQLLSNDLVGGWSTTENEVYFAIYPVHISLCSIQVDPDGSNLLMIKVLPKVRSEVKEYDLAWGVKFTVEGAQYGHRMVSFLIVDAYRLNRPFHFIFLFIGEAVLSLQIPT